MIGKATALSLVLYTPQVISTPFMNASQITSLPSANAFSIAGTTSSMVLTLVTPNEEPPTLVFMKHGKPTWAMMVSGVRRWDSDFRSNTLSATRMPNPLR